MKKPKKLPFTLFELLAKGKGGLLQTLGTRNTQQINTEHKYSVFINALSFPVTLIKMYRSCL